MSEVSVLNEKQRKKDDREKPELIRSVLTKKKDDEPPVHLGAHDEAEEIGT